VVCYEKEFAPGWRMIRTSSFAGCRAESVGAVFGVAVPAAEWRWICGASGEMDTTTPNQALERMPVWAPRFAGKSRVGEGHWPGIAQLSRYASATLVALRPNSSVLLQRRIGWLAARRLGRSSSGSPSVRGIASFRHALSLARSGVPPDATHVRGFL
jgi:hypothetical protein